MLKIWKNQFCLILEPSQTIVTQSCSPFLSPFWVTIESKLECKPNHTMLYHENIRASQWQLDPKALSNTQCACLSRKKESDVKPHYQNLNNNLNNSGIVTTELSQQILVVSPISKLIYQNKPLLMR